MAWPFDVEPPGNIASTSDTLAIVRKNLGIITSWNGGAGRIFDYLAEEIIGKPITILIPADCQREEEAMMGRVRRGQSVEHYETFRQRKHKGLIDVSLSISPVKDARQSHRRVENRSRHN